jgi:cellobiose phosphorylase
MQPKSFRSFLLQPYLPAGWKEMSLNHIKAFNKDFNITVVRAGQKLKIIVEQAGSKNQEINWDGRKAVEINLY